MFLFFYGHGLRPPDAGDMFLQKESQNKRVHIGQIFVQLNRCNMLIQNLVLVHFNMCYVGDVIYATKFSGTHVDAWISGFRGDVAYQHLLNFMLIFAQQIRYFFQKEKRNEMGMLLQDLKYVIAGFGKFNFVFNKID